MRDLIPLLSLILGLGCWTPDPGIAALAQAEGPVAVVGIPASAPATDIVLMVRAGSAHDPSGQEGVAWLTARLMREGGTQDRSPEAVDALLYRLGTDITVVVDKEIVTLRTRALHEDLPELLDLLGDMVVEPADDASALARLRDEAREQLTTGILGSDEALGLEVYENWVYEGNPYGHPVMGRTGSLPGLTASQVQAFRQDRWVRPAAVLGVCGPAVNADGSLNPDGPGAAAIQALRDRLVALPARPYKDAAPRGVLRPDGLSLRIIEKEATGTGLHFGQPTGLTRDHPDWPAILLAMTAFGEHRQSHGRLYRAIRGERGLNYGDYAYVEVYVQDGWSSRQQVGTGRVQNPFTTWIRPVSADNGPFALKAALSMVEELVEDGLSQDEVSQMQLYLPARLALWGEEPGRRLGWATEARLMGWPDPVVDLPDRLRALDRDTVNAAIRRHIHPGDLRVVAVTGDAAAFLAGLSADSPVVYAADPPPPGSPAAAQDAAWSSRRLDLQDARVLSADGIFQ